MCGSGGPSTSAVTGIAKTRPWDRDAAEDYSAARASLKVLDGRITAVVFSASGR